MRKAVRKAAQSNCTMRKASLIQTIDFFTGEAMKEGMRKAVRKAMRKAVRRFVRKAKS